MHPSSFLKVKAFFQVHAPARLEGPRSVLDIGSCAYGPKETYRSLADAGGLAYTGLDMQAGRNVDIVSKHPFLYDELANDSFDHVISGQAFEHNPFFWVTFCEVARVLKPGGTALIIAPSSGAVHRFPYDCWRFYPDSWSALCTVSGLELLEVMFEPPENRDRIKGASWRDSAVVARKPDFASVNEAVAFHIHLDRLTSPYRGVRTEIGICETNKGAVYDDYAKLVTLAHQATLAEGPPKPAPRPAPAVPPARAAKAG